MEIFTIPLENKFIIYRPLLRLAFIGNRAMANLVLDIAAQSPNLDSLPASPAVDFLRSTGFLAPDPAPPPPPAASFQPTHAALLLTNQCHLRCIYCYANAGVGPVQELSFALARAAIDRVCHNALELDRPQFELTFHGGGEPVRAWKVLAEAVAYARSKPLPCQVSMTSSGVWSQHQLHWIIDNLDGLTISIDGGPETQNRQRPFVSGQGSFATVMRTIAALDERNFPYGIRMTALPPWSERLPTDVRFLCQKTNCQHFQVEPAFNTVRGQHQWPSAAESEAFAAAFIEAFDIAGQANRTLAYTGARPWLLTHSFCTAPYNALIVNPAGRLVACYEVTDQNHPLIDISTFGEIVGDQVRVDEEARHALHTRLDERRQACRACFCYRHCAGDCYTRTFSPEVGSHKVLGQRCRMNRSITAQLLLRYIMAGDGLWQGNGTRQARHTLVAEG
ncbi:MAG: radical SAM protein [Anaerolineae bacterium]